MGSHGGMDMLGSEVEDGVKATLMIKDTSEMMASTALTTHERELRRRKSSIGSYAIAVSRACDRRDFGTAPTICCATWPFLKTIRFGMLLTR